MHEHNPMIVTLGLVHLWIGPLTCQDTDLNKVLENERLIILLQLDQWISIKLPWVSQWAYITRKTRLVWVDMFGGILMSRSARSPLFSLLQSCEERGKGWPIYNFLMRGDMNRFLWHYGKKNPHCHGISALRKCIIRIFFSLVSNFETWLPCT